MADKMKGQGRQLATAAEFMEQFFSEELFKRGDRPLAGRVWPRVDIIEEPNDYILKADLPGMKKDDIAISVDNGVLTIRGEKQETRQEEEKGRYQHLERSFGSFSRSFALPADVDQKNIDAHYKNGVLELVLRKTAEGKTKATEVKVD